MELLGEAGWVISELMRCLRRTADDKKILEERKSLQVYLKYHIYIPGFCQEETSSSQ
jgi:hypothetical protein